MAYIRNNNMTSMFVFNLIDKYYPEDNKLKRIFLSHACSVEKKALQIAAAHPELNVDEKFLSEAALLHDIGIFLTHAPAISCLGKAPYICHGYLGAELMRKEGFPRHALVCERHTGAGLSLKEIIERQLPVPHREMVPQSMEEQIICFADKFFSKTHLDEKKEIKKVQENIAKHGKEGLERFLQWKKLFGE
ncbi:hypothetical protein EZS27_031024 [termite gut metagenome]|uniref:HD domain-containing protein n=1 Tax=termite gut metagenome TaxID=433724 RepID=A0A5J4QBZ6_9ZZZZ